MYVRSRQGSTGQAKERTRMNADLPQVFFDTKLPEANTNPATRTDDSTVMQEENTLFSVIGFDLISSGTFRTYVVGTFDFKFIGALIPARASMRSNIC
jgi:hypothetical protein